MFEEIERVIKSTPQDDISDKDVIINALILMTIDDLTLADEMLLNGYVRAVYPILRACYESIITSIGLEDNRIQIREFVKRRDTNDNQIDVSNYVKKEIVRDLIKKSDKQGATIFDAYSSSIKNYLNTFTHSSIERLLKHSIERYPVHGYKEVELNDAKVTVAYVKMLFYGYMNAKYGSNFNMDEIVSLLQNYGNMKKVLNVPVNDFTRRLVTIPYVKDLVEKYRETNRKNVKEFQENFKNKSGSK